MKSIQSQRKFAMLWIFVFVTFQALGRPLHVLTGCPATCGIGSSCCVIDSSKKSSEGAYSHRSCCHSHSHDKPSQIATTPADASSGTEIDWDAFTSHECPICQWLSTPSIQTLAFSAPDTLEISSLSVDAVPIEVAMRVSRDQSPRGPPH